MASGIKEAMLICNMKKWLTNIIDFFYPPFKKLMPLQTFRYAACGSGNAVLGILTYIVGYRYIFAERIFDFGFLAFKPHNAALFLSSFISFVVGFILNKFLVFDESYLKGRIQLFRYFLSFSFNLIVNYFMLKVLVEIWHIDAVISQILTALLVIAISYFTQRHFTFKMKPDGSPTLTNLK